MDSSTNYGSIHTEGLGQVTNLEILHRQHGLESLDNGSTCLEGQQSEVSSYQTAYDPVADDVPETSVNGGSYLSDVSSMNTTDEDAILFGNGVGDEKKSLRSSVVENGSNGSRERSFNFGSIKTDPYQGHKATEIKLFSFARPHMRGFHGSWICFFTAFFIWFSIAPLLPVVQKSLKLTKSEIWLSNIFSVTGAAIMRFAMGPLCDKYGAKTTMTRLIAVCTIPCVLTGVANNLTTLCLLRFLISTVGGTFVAGQYWASCMFTKSIVGTAMAISGGWGVVGSGAANILMGSVVYPFMKKMTNDDEDLAWRTSFVIPSVITLLVTFYFYLNSDDCPYGNYKDLKKTGQMQERSALDSFRSGFLNLNSWILSFQYGASFGVELTMENGLATYLFDSYDLSIEHAAMYASLFGLTNIFSRGLGGYISDKLNQSISLRGRLYAQMFCMLIEGGAILYFSSCKTLRSTLFAMFFFSTFTQMAMGTCFGIVPYVDGPNTGSVAGIVGAGGSIGAIILGNVFRTNTYSYSFKYMGMYAIIMALLTPFIVIKNHAGICYGKEKAQHILLVPNGA